MECIIAQVEPTTLISSRATECHGGRDIPTIGAETATVEHAIVAIDILDQLILDDGPMFAQESRKRVELSSRSNSSNDTSGQLGSAMTFSALKMSYAPNILGLLLWLEGN
jgi:hypothetical protein